MATDVVMPQMGESIAEGTIVRWIKKVGDKVDRDEPLFEISTDKVDAEIPSPAAGVVTEIRVKEGETVPVNSVVAVIGAAGEQPAAAPAASAARRRPCRSRPPRRRSRRSRPSRGRKATAPARRRPARRSLERTPTAARRRRAPSAAGSASPGQARIDRGRRSASDRRRSCARSRRSTTSTSRRCRAAASPAASRRTTFWLHRAGRAGAGRRAGRGRRPAGRQVRPRAPEGARIDMPGVQAGRGDQVVPMSVMRKKIAEHMVLSRRTSAHVHSVFEVNFARIDADPRGRRKRSTSAPARSSRTCRSS